MVLKISRVTAALALAIAFGSPAAAQTNRLHFGPRASYQFDLKKLGVGVQLGVPIANHFEFYPSFDYYFVDAGSFWNLNADIKWRVAQESVNWLYLGTGLNLARSGAGGNHHSDAALNLFAGAESLRGRVHPFAELRFIVGDGSTAQISVGLNFTLGRH